MKRFRPLTLVLGLLVFFSGLGIVSLSQGEKPMARALAQGDNLRAPEFPANFKWLNTDKPLTLRALKGKIVLLDFWTYGCINCMHILPDLVKLERKYPNELVVISVHSAKFEHERDTENIRNAMLRYNIEHPVLVDEGMRVWEEYAVRAWPTFVLIDPDGRIVGSTAGEGNYQILDETIGKTAKEFRARGLLNETPLKLALDAAKMPQTPLWYPGKVVADEKSGHLFITDSNHNRVVIADQEGKVMAVAGSGERGLKDGAFSEAQFSNPQGMALRRSGDSLVLYVADTNNHAIRALDLTKATVTTVAGTGKQAPWRSTGGIGTRAALASPWDLLLHDNNLYIAMAGPHQIWRMNLKNAQVSVYAGTGREARTDGTLATSAFAQPSGLATDGKVLFIADSEISAIRAVDLPGTGRAVRTIAGGDLFDFGDRDGQGNAVRLQHPLGLDFRDGLLYVADTYNSKIKTLDPKTNTVKTWLGGKGDKDGAQPQFYEPGGIAFSGNRLYVADTNNHKIRVVDVPTKVTTTLDLENLPAALPAEPERPVRPVKADNTITLPSVKIAPGQSQLVLDLQLPARHHLNMDAPQRVQMRVEGTGAKIGKTDVQDKAVSLPLRVPLEVGANGEGAVIASVVVSYCTDAKGVCKVRSLRFKAPFTVAAGGSKELLVRRNVE